MAIGLNDMRWESDEARTEALDRFSIALLGTKTTDADDETRAWMATDWLVRVYTPAWLRLAGLTDDAQALESLARIADSTLARAARPTIDAARSKVAAAWDALAPTSAMLRASAIELLDAMIAVGKAA